MTTNQPVTWVVYQRTLLTNKKQYISNAVCEQSEWDELQAGESSGLTLVQDGFLHEGDAERHARGSSGEAVPGAGTLKR